MTRFNLLPQEFQDKILYMSKIEYDIAVNKHFFNTCILAWIKVEGKKINAVVDSINDDVITVSEILKQTMISVDIVIWYPLYKANKKVIKKKADNRCVV